MFKSSDGMPESDVIAVTVSPRTNVWVKHNGADEISRLDGYSVQTYPSPGHNNFRVYESRTGQLWSLYSSGLLVYVEASRQWVHRPVPEIEAEFQADFRRQFRQIPLVPAERNRVLFLLSDKLMEYDLSSKKAVVIRLASDTGLGRFVEMAETRQEGLLITGTKGLGKITGPLRRLHFGTNWIESLVPAELHAENLQRPFEDEQGRVIMVAADTTSNTRRLLLRFDGTNWLSVPVEAPKVNQAWPSWDGLAWGFTFNSLLRFDPPGLTNVHREKVWAGQYRDVAAEASDAFWLATSEGLFRYAPNLWRTPPQLDEVTSDVHACLQDQEERLWFASSDTLIRLKGDDRKRFRWPQGFEASFDTGDTLYLLADGRLLITAGERSLLFHPDTETFELLVDPSGRRFRILGQLPDRSLVTQGVLPEASDSGGFELQRFDGKLFHDFLRAPRDWIFGRDVSSFWADPAGDLWLGGTGGLARFRNGEFENFGAVRGFRGSKALWISPGTEGRLWAGTSDRIFEFNGKGWKLVRSGLERISRVARGRDDKVWVGTAQGLQVYANGSWLSHGVEEGLPSPGISDVLVDRQGNVWTATTRGISGYHPEADHSPPQSLTPVLENARVRLADEKAIILLNGMDRWFQTPGDRLLYSTRLDEESWSSYTNSMVKSFDHLDARKHRVEVRVMDRNWNESPEIATIEFWVVVSWYKDPRLLSSVVLGAVLVVFFASLAVNRHFRLTRSYAEVERIVALRTRELERANEELLRSQKMKALGTLAAGIAHDFNNILSIIKGSAQIIQDNLEDRQKILTRLSRIQSVVEQGAGIVKSILGLSRVKSKDIIPGDLNRAVEDTIKLLGDRFPQGLVIVFDPAPRLPQVLLVKELLQRMLLNLIMNASDAMDQRGKIQLRTRELGSIPGDLALSPSAASRYVGLSVEDDGTGIAPDILPRIFEPFFTTKSLSAQRGTGLGLSLVYEMARELGYGFHVTSKVGEGSVFTMILPVVDSLGRKGDPATLE